MSDTPDMLIARAIRKADTRYFFEDYTKQAYAAIEALEKAGYVIVPKVPTRDMFEAGKKSIVYGQNKPGNVILPLWEAMVDASPGPYGD